MPRVILHLHVGDVKRVSVYRVFWLYKLNLGSYNRAPTSGLKEEIKAQVMMQHPTTWLEAYERAKESKMVINAQRQIPSSTPRPQSPLITTPSPSTTQTL
jgi:hypothetical protein